MTATAVGRARWAMLRWALLVALAVAAGLQLAASADWRAALATTAQRLETVPAAAWLFAVLGLTASYLLRGLRLHAEWGAAAAAGRLECVRVTVQHIAATNLAPMRAGELALPWLMHRRWGVGVADAALSLLWLRLQDALVLAALAVWCFAPLTPPWRLAVIAAGAATAAWLLHQVRRLDVRSLGARAGRFVRAVQRSRGGGPAWVYASGNWVVKLAVLGALLAHLSGIDARAAWSGALGGELGALLPLPVPAGVGTYEAGVWSGVRLATRIAPELALLVAAALTVHAITVVISCAAGFLAAVSPGHGPARNSMRASK